MDHAHVCALGGAGKFAACLDGQVLVDAVAPEPGYKPLAVVGIAGAQVSAHRARIYAPVAQALLKHLGMAEKILHQNGLPPERIAHDHSRLAIAREQWKVVDGKGAGRDLRGLPQSIVDVQLHRAGSARKPGNHRQRLRNKTRAQSEVAA
ncbi:hypothetical protein D9M73_58480 [compost metagenome]